LPSVLNVLLRFLIPLTLAAVVVIAAATAPRHRVTPSKSAGQPACVHSDRQLAAIACRR
jgi:hypothetical protein